MFLTLQFQNVFSKIQTQSFRTLLYYPILKSFQFFTLLEQ